MSLTILEESVNKICTILMILILSGCTMPSGVGAGPVAWIDRPLEGDEAPSSQSVTIQAHASDADGVTRFEFFAADSLLGVVPAGGGRLGEASLEWQPPGPGVYLLGVRAEDAQGNQGTMVSVQITITGTAGETATSIPAPASDQCAAGSLVAPALLSPVDGATVEAPPLLAWSYPDSTCHPYSYTVDISNDSSFADNSLGFGTLDYNETSRQWPLPPDQCYYWRVKAYVPDVSGPSSPAWKFCVSGLTTVTPSAATFTLLKNANCRLGPGTVYDSIDAFQQGISVAIEGRTEDNSWFWVLKPSGSGHCWVSASVGVASGNWQAVPVLVAPPLPTDTSPAPPVDTTPPDVSDLGANPAIISVQTQCGATPPTTTITARVADASGIARVVARVSGVGEFDMSPVGGYYQVTIGPFSDAGTLSIFVQAQDNADNASTSAPIEVQVVACPG